VPVIIASPDINHTVNPILSLGDGTAIAVWSDDRSNTTLGDIYAAKFGGTDGLLPVKLLSFTATLVNAQTQLNWTTTQEINNSYFEVQRSDDGVNFSALTTVQADESGSSTKLYSAIDPSPYNGYTYYRLKQVDINGKYTYSIIVSVKAAVLLSLYPNPVKNVLCIKGLSTATSSNLSIIDFSGRLLQRTSVNQNSNSLDVQKLPSGNYYIRIESDKQVNTLRFIKE
jgi:trimeric autotransporter adhesin